MHILIAEDNMISQKLISRMLRDMGHTCDIASNGHEVLSALSQFTCGLILMDVNMPVLDGYHTTQRIIEDYGDKRPRIIAMTAGIYEEDKQRCLASGMDDYISKPVTPETLQALLERWKTDIP